MSWRIYPLPVTTMVLWLLLELLFLTEEDSKDDDVNHDDYNNYDNVVKLCNEDDSKENCSFADEW